MVVSTLYRTCNICLLVCRVEHEGFTKKDTEAYTQLVRVVVRDFLPFVKQVFSSLYSESQVESLALCTPYCLRHRTGPPPSSAGLASYKVGVDLNMQLDVKEMGEVLRGVAPEVFEELEHAEQSQGLGGVGVAAGDLGGAGGAEGGGTTESSGGNEGGVGPEKIVAETSPETSEGVTERTEQIPTHLALKQD